MSDLSDNFVAEVGYLMHSSLKLDSIYEAMQHDRAATQRMIKLLEDYVNHLQEHNSSAMDEAYLFPSDNATPEEWEMFDNVYQIHCPKIFLSSAIRDVSCTSAARRYSE